MTSGPYEYISQYPAFSQIYAAEEDTRAALTGEHHPLASDVLLTGMLFFDIVFTGLPAPPAPGKEVWTHGMGSAPGGIANLAVAAARLGLSTALAAGFSTDVYGEWMWRTLRDQEHIDLTYSRQFRNWHTPVTVSLAYDGDRALVTHGHPTPAPMSQLLADPPPTRAVMIDLGDPLLREAPWWRTAAQRGSLVFADAGWDPKERWDREVLESLDHVHAFTPNAAEAMGYTRTTTPEAALSALADLVPLAVVTDGANGVMAIDSTTGEQVHVPALAVVATDPTGAGDVFAAALTAGTLRGWPLEWRLRFAALCSALAVQESGGSLAAPGWGDVLDWWRAITAAAGAGDDASARTAQEYGFLTESLVGIQPDAVRRAEATIAYYSDVGPDSESAPPVFEI